MLLGILLSSRMQLLIGSSHQDHGSNTVSKQRQLERQTRKNTTAESVGTRSCLSTLFLHEKIILTRHTRAFCGNMRLPVEYRLETRTATAN